MHRRSPSTAVGTRSRWCAGAAGGGRRAPAGPSAVTDARARRPVHRFDLPQGEDDRRAAAGRPRSAAMPAWERSRDVRKKALFAAGGADARCVSPSTPCGIGWTVPNSRRRTVGGGQMGLHSDRQDAPDRAIRQITDGGCRRPASASQTRPPPAGSAPCPGELLDWKHRERYHPLMPPRYSLISSVSLRTNSERRPRK